MQYKNLSPACGLKVSRIILGCMGFGSPKWIDWVVDEEAAMVVLKRAWDLGITTFDTSDLYSNGLSEKILGNFIKKYNIPRDEIVVMTKVIAPVDEQNISFQVTPQSLATFNRNKYGLSRKHIMHAVEDSLRRLQLDYIDLYQIHRWDDDTPIEETMEALNDLVRAGKVRYIGASSMFGHQFYKAQMIAEKRGYARFVSMQNLYNAVYREEEREMIPVVQETGAALIPWSPLARGALGKSADDDSQSNRQGSDLWNKFFYAEDKKAVRRAVEEIAKKKGEGVTMAQVALAWMLHKDVVTAPIVGVTNAEHLDDVVKALDVKLTEEEIQQIERDYVVQPVFGLFPTSRK